MILAVDIGNSRTHYGVFDHDVLIREYSHPTSLPVEQSFFSNWISLYQIDEIAIASVVPTAVDGLSGIFHVMFPAASITVLDNAMVPITNLYRQPEQVGIDRLLASLAAYQAYGLPHKRPIIVIDLGTATTFDCVSADGAFLGGIIALGIQSSASALSALTAQLPMIDLNFPKHVLGTTTIESIESGILFGALSMIEGLVERLRIEVFASTNPFVVATGGLSSLIAPRSNIIDHVDTTLVLRGIVLSLRLLLNE